MPSTKESKGFSAQLNFSVVGNSDNRLPEWSENLNTASYVNWGPDNKFPEWIQHLYNESNTLHSVLDGTAEYIAGNGVNGPLNWSNEVNRNGDDLQSLVLALATDQLLYNAFAVQVVYNRLGVPVELYPLSMSRIRLSADRKKVYYAGKWGNYTSRATYKEYDAWDPAVIDPENLTQIYVWRSPSAKTIYPMPFWRGCWRACMSQIASSKYVLNNLSNGLAAKTVITIPNTTGALTEDDKKALMESIQKNFCSPDAESSYFLFFREEGEEPMDIKSITTEDDSARYTALNNSCREEIFVAFRATGTLFGLPDSNNKGFSKTEYKEAFDLFQKTMVRPRQIQIEKVLTKLTGGEVNILPFKIDDAEE